MKKINVVFGKFGKSMLFKKSKWGMIGGDHEAPALVIALAQMNPNINFYLLGRSDWSRIDPNVTKAMNPNGNIIDIWEKYTENRKEFPDPSFWPLHYFKKHNIKIDFGYILSGLNGNTNTHGTTQKIDGTGIATALYMLNTYSGPIVRLLNEYRFPWVEVGEDPRYFPAAGRDLIHRPNYIVITKDKPKTMKVKIMEEYLSHNNIIMEMPTLKSSYPEYFLMNEENVKLKEPGDRKNTLSVYSNGSQSSGGKPKFPAIKEYVLDLVPDSIMYGKWSKNTPEIGPYLDRIKPIPMIDLIDQMYDTKYAFMIPIQDSWPTCKYYKHLLFGIIPFFHPRANADNSTPAPDFTKLESSKDFKQKIDFLNKNPKEYLKLWEESQSYLRDDAFTGERANKEFLDLIKKFCDTSGIDLSTKEIKFKISCMFKDNKQDKIENKKSKKTVALF